MHLLLMLYVSFLYKQCLRKEIYALGKDLVILVVRESPEISKYIILSTMAGVAVFVSLIKRV